MLNLLNTLYAGDYGGAGFLALFHVTFRPFRLVTLLAIVKRQSCGHSLSSNSILKDLAYDFSFTIPLCLLDPVIIILCYCLLKSWLNWYLKVSFNNSWVIDWKKMNCVKVKNTTFIEYYLLEVCLQIITAPHVLIRDAFVADAILKVFLDGIVGQVDASTDVIKYK